MATSRPSTIRLRGLMWNRQHVRGRRLALAALLAAACAAHGADPAPATKDHILFVGSNYSVKRDGTYRPVVGAGDRTFVVQLEKKTAEYPLSALKDIRISRGLKLTQLTATLQKFDATMSSDAAVADIMEATQTSMALSTVADINRDRAIGRMIDADLARGAVGATQYDGVFGHDMTVKNIEQEMTNAFQAYVNNLPIWAQQTGFAHETMLDATGTAANSGDAVDLVPEISDGSVHLVISGDAPHRKPAETEAPARKNVESRRVRDLADGRADRFDLSFEVSSAQPLENAYIVLVTEYSAPKYGTEVFRRILTENLGRIDATPRKVELYQTAFPAGFHLRTYTLGLYANGQEVATNVSDTKMTMTREEAYEYFVVDYLSSHKGQTLPPAAILMAPRAELKRLVPAPDLQRPLYVAVSDKGEPTTISTDPRRQAPPSPAATAALRHFRFIPAIDKGVPVEGRAKLVLAEFAR